MQLVFWGKFWGKWVRVFCKCSACLNVAQLMLSVLELEVKSFCCTKPGGSTCLTKRWAQTRLMSGAGKVKTSNVTSDGSHATPQATDCAKIDNGTQEIRRPPGRTDRLSKVWVMTHGKVTRQISGRQSDKQEVKNKATKEKLGESRR